MTTTPQGAIAHRLLRRKQVEQAIGLSRSAIYSRLDPNSKHHDPDFPKPIQLSASSTSVAWVEEEVQAYIALRIADSRKEGVADIRRASIVGRRKPRIAASQPTE